MDIDEMEENNHAEQHHVDTSRPFSSVKEAVAIFGQRIMLPIQTQTLNSKPASPIATRSVSQAAKPRTPVASPSISQTAISVSPIARPSISQTTSLPSSPWKQRSLLPSSPQGPKEEIMDVLKKLEAEITETKTEVKMLKERESETEVALATLNAELHKNMSKMAKAEADAAGKSAAAMTKSVSFKEPKEKESGDEERRKELTRRIQKEYPSLAQILESNKGNRDGYFAKTTKKKKKKPIIPLVGDFFFFKKKESRTEISGPLYTTSSTLHF
ncbi:PREDICTED: uncharacterized protein LOC104787483 [Camelina sativa]|uniref:Uncharacterized protein LOC104787483 n=1 Tax=Camelina sativa TaxID=90675 RepID=A0ABM0Z764_CAMSA|nr:PREDICTED: uncharacterized protein LOC104787483 [Camelina sativa]